MIENDPCMQRNNHAEFSKKLRFLTPCYAHVPAYAYEGVRTASFIGKFWIRNKWMMLRVMS